MSLAICFVSLKLMTSNINDYVRCTHAVYIPVQSVIVYIDRSLSAAVSEITIFPLMTSDL